MFAYYEKKLFVNSLFVNYFYFFLHNKTNNAKAAKQEKKSRVYRQLYNLELYLSVLIPVKLESYCGINPTLSTRICSQMYTENGKS